MKFFGYVQLVLFMKVWQETVFYKNSKIHKTCDVGF